MHVNLISLRAKSSSLPLPLSPLRSPSPLFSLRALSELSPSSLPSPLPLRALLPSLPIGEPISTAAAVVRHLLHCRTGKRHCRTAVAVAVCWRLGIPTPFFCVDQAIGGRKGLQGEGRGWSVVPQGRVGGRPAETGSVGGETRVGMGSGGCRG